MMEPQPGPNPTWKHTWSQIAIATIEVDGYAMLLHRIVVRNKKDSKPSFELQT